MSTLEGKAKELAPVAPEFSEDALAQLFADRHGDDTKYVSEWGRWMLWDGKVWRRDDTQRTIDLSRAVCREIATTINKPKESKALASRRTVSNVEALSQSDRKIAATTAQWDADPWAFNTPGGVIDLRTGITRPHCREDYMTKSTKVVPGGECPLWQSFLVKITCGDADLAAYLQRLAGYSLTGDTSEHAMFFAYGGGSNGKTTYTNVILGILGDYAMTSPMDAFVVSHNERHPTEIADLRGARFVTAQETEEGRRWAEGRIKQLTGGEGRIKARFMRQDFFEFTPQFKLFISGNYKPSLRGVNDAIRRRMNLIPFAAKISEAEKDKDFGDKLVAEWPGILAWMIEGCKMWVAAGGLKPPAAVLNATKEYLEEEDSTGSWFTERCTKDINTKIAATVAWENWREWATSAEAFVGDRKRFYRTLEEGMGFERKTIQGSPWFYGFTLRPYASQQRQQDAPPGHPASTTPPYDTDDIPF